jgi:hypothetical protein
MHTVAATRQTPRADLTSAPKALDWAVYIRENVKLTASARSLAFLLMTLGQGQNITMSQANMAKSIGMRRDTVASAIKELHQHGLLAAKASGRNRTTVYRLTMPVQVVPVEDQLVVPVEDQLVVPVEDHNIEQKDKDRQDELHQHPDDDVAIPDASSNRAKRSSSASRSTRASEASSAGSAVPADKVPGDSGVPAVPPVEEFIADLEGCVDELARRLDVDPGSIDIKPLAKMWRGLYAGLDCDPDFISDLLDICPADDSMWAYCASKDNPVGYMMFRVKQVLQGNDVTAPTPKVVRAVDEALAARVAVYLAKNGSTLERDFYEAVGSDYEAIQPVLSALVDSSRILRSKEPNGLYYWYKVA